MKSPQKRLFQSRLLKWSSGRNRDFIWRKPGCTPFLILVSEMLLRKTKAETVDIIVRGLFRKYPTPNKLARAKFPDLSEMLRPLGLFRMRSRAIVEVARRLSGVKYKRFLGSYKNIVSLPHVGRYTANAVLCFAFDQRRPIVDGNVVRLFNRFFGTRVPIEVHKADDLWELAEGLLPPNGAKEFNWALLDMARSVCRVKSPNCHACPISKGCLYFKGEKKGGRKQDGDLKNALVLPRG